MRGRGWVLAKTNIPWGEGVLENKQRQIKRGGRGVRTQKSWANVLFEWYCKVQKLDKLINIPTFFVIKAITRVNVFTRSEKRPWEVLHMIEVNAKSGIRKFWIQGEDSVEFLILFRWWKRQPDKLSNVVRYFAIQTNVGSGK